MKTKERFSKKLLVEGNDDQHVIWALCEKFNVAETFDVIDCEGITRLREEIPQRLKESGIAAVGIIVDADTEINNRWTSLRDILTRLGFHVPEQLPATGFIHENADGLKVGVWVMPNNNLEGMLEDFITFLVPQDDNLMPIVNTTLDHIQAQQLNKYSTAHRSKAAIHSWLAWQETPGTPIGMSITKRYLTTDLEICNTLVNWIQQLFG